MRIILRSDVSNLGNKGDMIDVADGYARNYLVPKGLAIQATNGAVKQAESMRRSRQVRDMADKQGAEATARQLISAKVTITARSGEGGKLFGSVTAADVAAAVEAQTGIAVDRRKLSLDEPIKTLGTHEVPIRLHAEVEVPITVEVVSS